ncbi:MAG: hypothetical protein WEC59_12350 [Salibacteraceae bacterium]
MKKDKMRDRNHLRFERDIKIKKVDARKAAKNNWKRFLETEDFDE